MMVEIASRWIEDGTAQALVDWQIKAVTRRNRIASETLQGLSFLNSPTGLHVWLPLGDIDEASFVSAARQSGVAVAPGAPFCIDNTAHQPAVRICLGGVSETRLREGLSAIRQLAMTLNASAMSTT